MGPVCLNKGPDGEGDSRLYVFDCSNPFYIKHASCVLLPPPVSRDSSASQVVVSGVPGSTGDPQVVAGEGEEEDAGAPVPVPTTGAFVRNGTMRQ